MVKSMSKILNKAKNILKETNHFLEISSLIKNEKQIIAELIEEIRFHYDELDKLATEIYNLEKELKLKGVVKNVAEII